MLLLMRAPPAGLIWVAQEQTGQLSRVAALCCGPTGTGAATCRHPLQGTDKSCPGRKDAGSTQPDHLPAVYNSRMLGQPVDILCDYVALGSFFLAVCCDHRTTWQAPLVLVDWSARHVPMAYRPAVVLGTE